MRTGEPDGESIMFRTRLAVAGVAAAALLAGATGPAMAKTGGSPGPGTPPATSPPVTSPPITAPPVTSSPTTSPLVTSPPIAPPVRRTQLTLSYMADAGYAAALKLGCDPATGPHPHRKQACAELKKAGGRPDRLTPTRSMCYLIYAPIRADITGTWKGRPVTWSKTYGNQCEMNRATGVLFQF